MMRALALAALAAGLLVGVLVANALRFESKQVPVEPAPGVAVDADAVAARLAAALRIPTISHQDRSRLDRDAFLDLHAFLAARYPGVHATLRRESVGGLSLLYTWPGSDPELPPLVLCAHLDVVPVEDGTEDQWTRPAFAGEIADGFVWGRGAMDDKGPLIGILEAVEALVAEGFRPRRTLYLAFGHDEEVSGADGAQAIAELLRSRGVEDALVLDEGGALAQDAVPGIAQLALVGIAEKGSVSIALDVEVPGGHSSVPPRQTAVGILSRAVDRLERHPLPGELGGVTRQLVEYVGPELPFSHRLVLANLWLFAPILEALSPRDPSLDAMLRTTTAPTMFRAGVKENVLASSARAVVNFRIAPQDSVAGVAEHVRRTIDDRRISLQVGVRSEPREPTVASPVDGEEFALIQRTLGEIFPGAVVSPYLVLGGTDARFYSIVSRHLYRVSPFPSGRDDLARIHGTDERMSVDALADMVRFYRRLIRNANTAGRVRAPA